MINKYMANGKDLKEYKIKNCRQGTAKNGATYNMCQISDSKKGENGNYIYDNYTLFTWQDGIKLADNDKIVIEDITALEVVENEYNGKKYLKKTIFADIRVTQSANPNKVEVVGELPNLEPIPDDILPFWWWNTFYNTF